MFKSIMMIMFVCIASMATTIISKIDDVSVEITKDIEQYGIQTSSDTLLNANGDIEMIMISWDDKVAIYTSNYFGESMKSIEYIDKSK